MPKTQELLELAERCEQAKAPRWDIDESIAKALGWYCRKETGLGLNGRTPGRTVWRRPDHVKAPLPKFSKSLDAAMTLVPEGHDMQISLFAGRNGEGSAIVSRLKQIGQPRVFAATPALALCAASLRARSQ